MAPRPTGIDPVGRGGLWPVPPPPRGGDTAGAEGGAGPDAYAWSLALPRVTETVWVLPSRT